MRIGHGYDVHRFCEGDHVMLGGVRIEHAEGLAAHSDGDVVLHALCDALLGAIGAGDIGRHFPDDGVRQGRTRLCSCSRNVGKSATYFTVQCWRMSILFFHKSQ